jgi:ABC-type phosphate transport system auxiliary subunit
MEITNLIGIIGGLLGIGSLIISLINNQLSRRKLKAETRNIELDGDLKSVKLINELTGKIEKQEVRIDKLEKEVRALKGENHDISYELFLYKEAAKKLVLCTNNENCPMAKEFNRLKKQ